MGSQGEICFLEGGCVRTEPMGQLFYRKAGKRLQGECPGRREEAVLLIIGRVVEHLLVCPALGAAVLGRNLIESTASARDFLPLRVSHKRKRRD